MSSKLEEVKHGIFGAHLDGVRHTAGDGARRWDVVLTSSGKLVIFESAAEDASPVALGTAVDLETAQRFVNGLALLT